MAQIEALLYTRLTTNSGVSALIANRVYPGMLPQAVTYPALRYVLIDRVEVIAKPTSGTLRIMRARLQMDVYAATYSQAKAVAAAVKAAIYGWKDPANGVISARIVDENDANDSEETMQRVSLDGSITYNE